MHYTYNNLKMRMKYLNI